MKKKLSFLIVLFMAFTIILSACGGGESSGDAVAAGEELFSQSVIGNQPGCITCHSLQEGVVIVGPSIAGIGSRAGSTISNMSAEDYLQQSILDPDAYLVEGFPAGTMPQVWEGELTGEQVDQLIAYMLTLN